MGGVGVGAVGLGFSEEDRRERRDERGKWKEVRGERREEGEAENSGSYGTTWTSCQHYHFINLMVSVISTLINLGY